LAEELTEAQVKNLIYEELPCATNKICNQVKGVEDKVYEMKNTLRYVT
jgi:hypothetical protein